MAMHAQHRNRTVSVEQVSEKEVPCWSDIADSLLQLAKTAEKNQLSPSQAQAMRAFYAGVLSDKAQTFRLQRGRSLQDTTRILL